MWELDYKESWAPKNWWFWTVVLEKTLESPLDCKEIQPVHLKGDQSWVFIGRTDVEAEIPILWPPDAESWLIQKDPYARKDWGQEKGTTEDEMVGWHVQHNGHGFGWALGVGDGQGGLAYCGSWGRKELDTTEQLNWITLQYCSGFAIHWYESFISVHVFPILKPPLTCLPIPSLRVIPVHQPWALCLMHWGLAIYFTYDNINVSMLVSQIIPPLPSPTESKSLFFISMSLAISHIGPLLPPF